MRDRNKTFKSARTGKRKVTGRKIGSERRRNTRIGLIRKVTLKERWMRMQE